MCLCMSIRLRFFYWVESFVLVLFGLFWVVIPTSDFFFPLLLSLCIFYRRMKKINAANERGVQCTVVHGREWCDVWCVVDGGGDDAPDDVTTALASPLSRSLPGPLLPRRLDDQVDFFLLVICSFLFVAALSLRAVRSTLNLVEHGWCPGPSSITDHILCADWWNEFLFRSLAIYRMIMMFFVDTLLFVVVAPRRRDGRCCDFDVIGPIHSCFQHGSVWLPCFRPTVHLCSSFHIECTWFIAMGTIIFIADFSRLSQQNHN